MTPRQERRRTWFACIIVCLLWVLVLFLTRGAAASPVFTGKYDTSIQTATKKFWLDYSDWKFWKAQLYQESRLDPAALSPAGAAGIAQFMGPTWNDISKALGFGLVSRSIAEPSILGGAYYMAQLRRTWRGRGRPITAQHELAEASYNAGTGSILDAQRACMDALLWTDILPCLAGVTGISHARETSDYVVRIAGWRKLME